MENSSLPKIAPAAPAQIFIHPEHAQGTLKVPSPTITDSPHRLFNFLAVFAILILFLILAGGYFLIPRARTVIFARDTKETMGELSSKTDKVNTSLSTLYKSLTPAQSTQGTTTIDTGVLGLESSSTKKITDNSFKALGSAFEAVEKNSKVKGFAVPQEDPNKLIREQRNLAKEVETNKQQADTTIKQISAISAQKVSGNAKDLEANLEANRDDTTKYLSEAEKTSDYYVSLSDASIELYNLSTSLTTPKDVEIAVPKLTALRNKFADYDKTKLPEQIGDLNKDVVGIFDLLINFFKDVSSGKISSEEALLSSYNNFLAETKTLASQSSVHELNFWQNNETLSNYKKLSESHTELIKAADKIKSQNNFFLLTWFGVK